MSNDQDNLDNYKIVDNTTIPSSGVFRSPIINANERKLIGNITLQLGLTGDGTAKVEWEQSNNFDNSVTPPTGEFVKAVSGHEVTSGFTKTSGTDSDGKDLFNVPMFNSLVFRFVVTETSTTNEIIVDAWLSMQ